VKVYNPKKDFGPNERRRHTNMNRYLAAFFMISLAVLPLTCCFSAYWAMYLAWVHTTPIDEGQKIIVANWYYLFLSICAVCIVSWIGVFMTYWVKASKKDIVQDFTERR
jgi:hypothetical protein